jgi:hypothetical protein
MAIFNIKISYFSRDSYWVRQQKQILSDVKSDILTAAHNGRHVNSLHLYNIYISHKCFKTLCCAIQQDLFLMKHNLHEYIG